MKLIYNINWKRLTNVNTGETIDLTKLEWRFIECLAHGNVVTWDELVKYIYKHGKDKHSIKNMYAMRHRLSKKLKLNTCTKNTIGIWLKDEILLDYI